MQYFRVKCIMRGLGGGWPALVTHESTNTRRKAETPHGKTYWLKSLQKRVNLVFFVLLEIPWLQRLTMDSGSKFSTKHSRRKN